MRLLILFTLLCSTQAFRVANIYSDDELVEALSTIPKMILLQGDKHLKKTAMASFYFNKHAHHFLENNFFPFRYITNLDGQEPRVGMFVNGNLVESMDRDFSNAHLWFYKNFPREDSVVRMYREGEKMDDKHLFLWVTGEDNVELFVKLVNYMTDMEKIELKNHTLYWNIKHPRNSHLMDKHNLLDPVHGDVLHPTKDSIIHVDSDFVSHYLLNTTNQYAELVSRIVDHI